MQRPLPPAHAASAAISNETQKGGGIDAALSHRLVVARPVAVRHHIFTFEGRLRRRIGRHVAAGIREHEGEHQLTQGSQQGHIAVARVDARWLGADDPTLLS